MSDPAGSIGWRVGPAAAAAKAERVGHDEPPPIGVLLLPRQLESFLLRDQAEDLLSAPGVVAVEPARIPYGAYLRLPVSVADGLAATQARRLKLPGVPRVIVIFHPLQYPLARGMIAQHPDAELWYWQWDRFEAAYDASPRQRERLQDLHVAASLRASVNIVVTDALGELVDEGAGEPQLVPLAADSFPAPEPGATVVAVSLGHLGHRTDWKLLRAVAEGMPELVLLLIGEWHADESGHDEDFQACRRAPNLVWLGHRSDDEAARLILCADVGIVPFERSHFNETGLPYRILKYARLGRRTVSRDLKGVRTWGNVVTTAETPQEWITALRAHAGARSQPDAEVRAWALSQTAHEQNRPLWERMEALGIESGRLGSERGVRAPDEPAKSPPADSPKDRPLGDPTNNDGTPPRSRRKRRVRTPDSAG